MLSFCWANDEIAVRIAMIVRIIVFFIAAEILSFVNITITFDNFIGKNKDPLF